MKDADSDLLDTGPNSPNRLLLHKLIGTGAQRPRYQSPASFWRKSHKAEIETETLRRAQLAGVTKKKIAPIREKVVKELYAALEPAVRADWTRIAKDDHDEAVAKWENDLKGPASTCPIYRQK